MMNVNTPRPRIAAIATFLLCLVFALAACSAAPDPAVEAGKAAASIQKDITAYVEQFEGRRMATVLGIRCDGIHPDTLEEQFDSEVTLPEELTFVADCSYQKEAWQPISDAGVENGYRFFYCSSQNLNVKAELENRFGNDDTSFPKSSGTVSCVNYSTPQLDIPPCEDGFPNCPQWLDDERAKQAQYEQRDVLVFSAQ